MAWPAGRVQSELPERANRIAPELQLLVQPGQRLARSPRPQVTTLCAAWRTIDGP
jgi:hypothetical protein